MIIEHPPKYKETVLLKFFAILIIVGVAYLTYYTPVKQAVKDTCDQEGYCLLDLSTYSWLTSTSSPSGVTFEYPEKLTTKYMSAVGWPPTVSTANTPFTCTEAGSEIAQRGQTMKRTVDDRIYCVTKESEGAAGSIYTNYIYKTEKSDKVLVFTFSLRSTQCANYDEPQKSECMGERETFDIDSVVDRIVQSAVLK